MKTFDELEEVLKNTAMSLKTLLNDYEPVSVDTRNSYREAFQKESFYKKLNIEELRSLDLLIHRIKNIKSDIDCVIKNNAQEVA